MSTRTERAARSGPASRRRSRRRVILGVTGYLGTLTLQRPGRKGIDMALTDLARQIG
jgi:hypothetical protein